MFISSLKKLLEHAMTGQDFRLVLTAAATVKVYQQHVRCSTSGAGQYTVTLPNAAACAGLMYYVVLTTKVTDNVLVSGNGATIATLDTTDDWVYVVSTGNEWRVLGGLYT